MDLRTTKILVILDEVLVILLSHTSRLGVSGASTITPLFTHHLLFAQQWQELAISLLQNPGE